MSWWLDLAYDMPMVELTITVFVVRTCLGAVCSDLTWVGVGVRATQRVTVNQLMVLICFVQITTCSVQELGLLDGCHMVTNPQAVIKPGTMHTGVYVLFCR